MTTPNTRDDRDSISRSVGLPALALFLALSACGGGDGVNTPVAPNTHLISGTVSGATVAGVSIALTGASTATTTTDGAGAYSFSGLADGAYTVTATKAGYTFTPPSQSVTLAGADATGRNFTSSAVAPNTHLVSGAVSGATVSGVSIALTGAATATTTTDGAGAYSFSGLADGAYTVTPSKAGFTFTPPSQSVTLAGADVTGRNFTAAAVAPNTHLISGTVSGATTSGVSVALTGAATATTTTDGAGTYSFTGLADGAYTVTPTKTGFTFTPATLSVTLAGADVTGRNFTAASVPMDVGALFPRDPFPGEPLKEGNFYPAMAVDGTGRIHLAFLTNFVVPGGIAYSTCASSCADPSSWKYAVIEDDGTATFGPSLALDAAGHPRIVYVNTLTGASVFRYLACDAADCTTAGAWRGQDVVTALGPFWELEHGALAIDPQGHPAFLRERGTGSSLYLDRCTAADCFQPGAWTETELLSTGVSSEMSLAIDGSGVMHLGMRRENFSQVVYWRCEGACGVAASWREVAAWDLGTTGQLRLQVDGSGRPRMVAYSTSATVAPDQVVYMACDSNCAAVAGWQARAIGIPSKNGLRGLDLALDAAGSPRVAYSVQGLSASDGIGIAYCDGSCTANTGSWLAGTLEEATTLPPLLLPLGCLVGSWSSGDNARIAVGPGGKVTMAYDNTHRHTGNAFDCPTQTDQYLVRVLLP